MTLKAKITDPEVVFVANLTKADAPALTASFQCNLSLSTSKLEQMMEASVRDLKVLAWDCSPASCHFDLSCKMEARI